MRYDEELPSFVFSLQAPGYPVRTETVHPLSHYMGLSGKCSGSVPESVPGDRGVMGSVPRGVSAAFSRPGSGDAPPISSRGDKRALFKHALCSLPDFWP